MMHLQEDHSTTATELEEDAPKVSLDLFVAVDRPSAADPVPKLAYGVVGEGAALTVRFADRTRAARRAKSCLVDADPGDRVLCAIDGDVAHVLAVLEGGADARISTPGRLEVRAEGALDLSSGQSVGLRGAEVSVVSDRLKLRAKQALAALEDLRILGRSVDVNIADRALVYAERIESRASRFLQRAKQTFRFVEEIEQVRAGTLDMRAEGLAAVRGENTIVAARSLAKLDGAQVKIG